MADREHDSGDVLARLEAMAPELPGAIEELVAEREKLDTRIRQLRKLAAALGEEPPAPTAQAKAKREKRAVSKSPVKKPSEEMLKRVSDAALAFSEPFTARELHESMSDPRPHESAVHTAVKYLREIEFLGAAGKRRTDGAPRPSETYRVLDADAVQRPSLAAVA